MNEEEKTIFIQELDNRIGSDITKLDQVYEVDNEVALKKAQLQRLLNTANKEVPSKLTEVLTKAEENTKQIEILQEKSEIYKTKVLDFLEKIKPLTNELNRQFVYIQKLEEVMLYLKSFKEIDDISTQLKQCNDDEEAVQLYGELKAMCIEYLVGHRAHYVREYTHYWHNILKDKLTKQYEDLLKLLKWPMTMPAQESSPPPKDVMEKFVNLTKYLLLIEEPKFVNSRVTGDFTQDLNPCLPVKILLVPLKKRFAFHFTGTRQTARIDRPEWFLTQTLTWIKDHQGFLRKYIQPAANHLQLRNVRAEDEFNAGLVALAAERLHTVLGLYIAQGLKGETLDGDAAFAHAVDETLGFHKEFVAITGKEANSMLFVLSQAEIFSKWISVEKKYAHAKMDEILSNPQWMEPVTDVGAASKEPRGADLFIALLVTIEHRYAPLPKPGHKIQFLELQLELLEEWRVRLTQILSAGVASLNENTFLDADDSPHAVTAVVNAAHHTRSVLLQWAHSLHYLQLIHYRRKFQNYTQSQHQSVEDDSQESDSDDDDLDISEAMSLSDVEEQAERLPNAPNDVSRQNSISPDARDEDVWSPTMGLMIDLDTFQLDDNEGREVAEGGVWGQAVTLLASLRDAGLLALAKYILLEFKAKMRDYKKQKWHSMAPVEAQCQAISPALCRPLSTACGRLRGAGARLNALAAERLRRHVAERFDKLIVEEVVLQSWWSPGGTEQLSHDVERNLVPAFAPPSNVATTVNVFPKLREAVRILKLNYATAAQMRGDLLSMMNEDDFLYGHIPALQVTHLTPTDVLQILQQRTDLGEHNLPSVMDLF